MKYDKLNFDSLYFAGMCSLSADEINSLEIKCFNFAVTTTRPNNEITFPFNGKVIYDYGYRESNVRPDNE